MDTYVKVHSQVAKLFLIKYSDNKNKLPNDE